jgi:uncharacterized membrane protein
MKTPNKVLMSQARQLLKGKWGDAIKVTATYLLLSIILKSIPQVGGIISLFISGPFLIGLSIYWLSFSHNQNPKLKQIFEGFHTWWRGFVAYILLLIYTLLWSLLLIVPGIIAAFSYSMTYFILAEDKNITVNDAIDKSKQMMKGNKWKLFCLECRFIGWGLLCLLTFGVGFLWLIPYMWVSFVKFYDDIKATKPEVSPI